MDCLIETIMADIKEPTSRYTGLILHQLDSIYPKDERRELVRRAVLSALGNRGLLTEIHSILRSHEVEFDRAGGRHE
ncbi:MAG: hypothetical protein R2827_03625 [Bdellovibrionales bacterium]